MSAPSPRHRTAALAWLRRVLHGRRRDVTLTEPVGRVRRWLQRMALPLVALAVVLGLVGGYFYVDGRINSLEQDRRARTAARDQQQAQLKDQIDAAAEARTRKLELQLCELIVGARVAPRVAKLRSELRCPPVGAPDTRPAYPAGRYAGGMMGRITPRR